MISQTHKSVFLVILLTLVMAVPVLADEPTICADNAGVWDDVELTCLISGTGQNTAGINYAYDVNYPTSIADQPFIVTAVNGIVDTNIDNFTTAAEDIPNSPGDLFMELTFEIYEYNADIFSVVFTISDYLGGAHPNSYFQTLTFDRATQQQLSLLNLFNGNNPLPTIEPIVVAALQAKLGNDAATLQWIQDGTGQDLNNYRNFAVDANNLIILFENYQVAPYAAGPSTVMIPLTELASIWNPSTAAASCAGSLPTRLVTGDRGRIAHAYSTLRTQPAGSPIEIVFAPAEFSVLQGPLCAGYGPLAWYEIEYDDGSTGWASESQVDSIWGPNQYWLEPVPSGL